MEVIFPDARAQVLSLVQYFREDDLGDGEMVQLWDRDHVRKSEMEPKREASKSRPENLSVRNRTDSILHF